jgi:hypothetical protein
MSEHFEAPQQQLKTLFEQTQETLQFGVGHYLLNTYDKERPIIYENDTPILHGAGYFFFCSGEQAIRHAPEAAERLAIQPHYELEFRYEPARYSPLEVVSDNIHEEVIYDVTRADSYVNERFHASITSERCLLYFITKDAESGLYEPCAGNDLYEHYDLDENPLVPTDILAINIPYNLTPEVCESLGAIVLRLPDIKSEGLVSNFEELCRGYEDSIGY